MTEKRRSLLDRIGFCGLVVLVGAYAREAEAGVNRWTSNGPAAREVVSVTVASSEPSVVYAGTWAGGVFRSGDAGRSWHAAGLSEAPVQSLAVDPTDSEVVYASLQSFLLRKTTDGGKTWRALPGSPPGRVVFDPTDTSTLYVFEGSSVYRSLDAGEHWTLLVVAFLDGALPAFALDPSHPQTLYISIQRPAPPGGGRPSDALDNGIYRSVDGGITWHQLNANYVPGHLAVDARNSSILYASDFFGFAKSVDGGVHWSGKSPLPGSGYEPSSFVLDPVNPGTIYYGSARGIFKTTDGAEHWTPSGRGLADPASVTDLVIDPSTPSTLYAAAGIYGVVKTVNEGARWTAINRGLFAAEVNAIAAAGGTVFASTSFDRIGRSFGDVFRGPDGGAWWVPLQLGGVQALAFDPTDPGVLYAGRDGVLKSTDGGRTWTTLAEGINGVVNAIAVDPATPGTLYAAADGVFKSTNGGTTWTQVHPGTPAASGSTLVIDPAHPATLYVGGFGAVFRSDDRGDNWLELRSGLPGFLSDRVRSIAIDPAATDTLYVALAGESGIIDDVYKSTDRGEHWTPTGPRAGVSVLSLAIDPNTPSTLYAGTDGAGVFRSPDAGAHWTAVNDGLTDLQVLSLAIDSSGSLLWAGTEGGGVFEYSIAAAPALEAIQPDSGPANTATPFVISGTGFRLFPEVRFGDVPARNVRTVDPTAISGSTPDLAPGQLVDVVLNDGFSGLRALPRGWFSDFRDVPEEHPLHAAVERVFRLGLSLGCGNGSYCPDAGITRAQAAIFLLRLEHGSAYQPAPASGSVFADVPADAFGAAWVEQLAAEGITQGCGGGNFCPGSLVSRAQMSVFLMRVKHGRSYAPPLTDGVFSDVLSGDPLAAWIEAFAGEGITQGCGGENFCPAEGVSRAQLAAFLVRTLELP